MTVRDLHENTSSTGVRIIGGDFAVKKLKREIRVLGQNALTELKIQFEQATPQDPPQEQAIFAGNEQSSTTESKLMAFKSLFSPFLTTKTVNYCFGSFLILVSSDSLPSKVYQA